MMKLWRRNRNKNKKILIKILFKNQLLYQIQIFETIVKINDKNNKILISTIMNFIHLLITNFIKVIINWIHKIYT